MFERIRKARETESGFTLIELLIVIIILGILAAIVVFAVSGITDRGQSSADATTCKILKTAEEAYYAKNTAYAGSQSALIAGGFLADSNTNYTIALSGGSYTITGAGC